MLQIYDQLPFLTLSSKCHSFGFHLLLLFKEKEHVSLPMPVPNNVEQITDREMQVAQARNHVCIHKKKTWT